MQEYEVLREFPARRHILEVGTIQRRDANSDKTKLLLEEGDIKLVEKISFKPIAVSRLAKVQIADKDYTEGDKKHFTYEEALEIEKKMKKSGWRLPTRHELVLITEEFAMGKDGKLYGENLVKNLGLVYGGGVNSSTLDRAGSNGYYWSSTAYNASTAYSLSFHSSGVYPSYTNNRYYGFSVRLVRDWEGE